MRIFLIHGMGRTPASMWGLAVRLRLAGHQPSLFGYSVMFETLERIAERFRGHIEKTLAGDREERPAEASTADLAETAAITGPIPYAVIGHSLGNIITRLALPELPAGFQRFIMLAPPNSSPAMARELQDHPLYQAVTRDAGQKLCDDEFYEDLPVPEVPALILAGTRGFGAPWHPLGHKVNDAVVALDETRLAGIEVEEVPGIHSFLMNRPDVFSRIRDFLSS